MTQAAQYDSSSEIKRAIAPREYAAIASAGARLELIDVRSAGEFEEVHVVGATHIPLERLDPIALIASHGSDGGPVYLICKSGSRAAAAQAKLHAAGFDRAICIEGGTMAWEQAGLPVVRGRAMMSLERQVRIAAGSMVLIGVALGFFVHPWLFGLSAFVGAGLVFSGITDTCGMGMILARMPWNSRTRRAEKNQ